jgi:hypothetical protein
MPLHNETFSYLQPTPAQIHDMNNLREAAAKYAAELDRLPDGPDKTYVLRKLREVAMWANVAITRHPDGAPRREETVSSTNKDGDTTK